MIDAFGGTSVLGVALSKDVVNLGDRNFSRIETISSSHALVAKAVDSSIHLSTQDINAEVNTQIKGNEAFIYI